MDRKDHKNQEKMTDQEDRMYQEDQMYQKEQTDQEDQMYQEEQTDQEDQMYQKEQTDQEDQMYQEDRTDQIDQEDQVKPMMRNGKGNKPQKKSGNMGEGTKVFLHVLQHVAITAGAALLLVILTGIFVYFAESGSTTDGTWKGSEVYFIGQEKAGTVFEDSRLFNEFLGESISDVVRFGAIRGQLEDDGQFNGRKEIDVTAFANRHYGTPSEYVTAQYYLEDLLSWAELGFAYNEGWVTGEEAAKFLNPTTAVTKVDVPSANADVDTVTYLNTDLEDVTYIYDVSGNILQPTQRNLTTQAANEYYPLLEQVAVTSASANELDTADTEHRYHAKTDSTYVTLLTNQYQTTENKNIEKYVSSWQEYDALCENLCSAAGDLLINYEIYEDLSSHFKTENTNVRYCIRKKMGDKVEVYTNLKLTGLSALTIDNKLTSQCDKFLIYDSAQKEFRTNSLIQEETVRHIVNGYQYAYPQDTRIWIGVDSNYPVSDIFEQGNRQYSGFIPYFVQLAVAAAGCFLIYLILLAVLTRIAGRAADEQGNRYIRLRREDKVPTEIMLALVVLTIIALIWSGIAIAEILPYWDSPSVEKFFFGSWLIPLICTAVFVCSLFFSFYYYGFVRRIKARSLWKDSLCRKLFIITGKLYRRLTVFTGSTVRYAYTNARFLVRVLLPVAVLIIVHFVIIQISSWSHNETMVTELLILLVLDIMMGSVIYLSAKARINIVDGIRKINAGDMKHKVDETYLYGDNLILAKAVNSIGDGISNAVETSMKDERMKADLITNVSHDIKTPLTSIINYIDLIKRENITDEKVKAYVEVLDNKSQRLKQLTDDLVEASKISSGNIALQWENINLIELIHQTTGEFSEKFEMKKLGINVKAGANNLMIRADSRRIWRVIENLFNNVCKYAMTGTRVYIEVGRTRAHPNHVVLSIKNISEQPLSVSADELTERFIRGDVARSTEGSGLGLSIAKSLTEAQNGSFEILMDGDLFKVVLTFPLLEQN